MSALVGMWKGRWRPTGCGLLVVAAILLASDWASGGEAADAAFDSCSLPVEVAKLPPDAPFVPVSAEIDLGAIAMQLGMSGVVDERSLRLYRILPDGGETEEAVQFSPFEQPRAKQSQSLPGTVPNTSFATERSAGDASEGPRVAGSLSWIARADAAGGQRYRLRFGVARRGRMIQVPFSPSNYRGFDDENRATQIRYFPRMQIRPQWPLDGAVEILDNHQLVTSYHIGPSPEQARSSSVRRPFLYPVNGPDGISLTEFGKPHDPTGSHAHHYSLWVAHASVAGSDFWSEGAGGIIAHEQLELLEDGPIYCRLVQRTRWIKVPTSDASQPDVPCLRERRTLTVYRAAGDFRLMDVELEFTPAASQAVELGKTTFGFLAARVAQSMNPFDGGGEIVNSRGDRNEQAVHLQRAEWLDQSGPIAEQPADGRQPGEIPRILWSGIALFDHPENVNHPTGWHCRNDGWAGASFNREAPYTIEPGQTLRLRYRIDLHRHDTVRGEVAQQYAAYRAPVAVRFGEPARIDNASAR